MVKFRMLVATMLVGCGGTAFSAADAPLHEDGGAAETSSVETDSGAGMLDHRVLSPEGSQEAGVGHDAAPGNDAGPVFNEAATTHDAQADAGDTTNPGNGKIVERVGGIGRVVKGLGRLRECTEQLVGQPDHALALREGAEKQQRVVKLHERLDVGKLGSAEAAQKLFALFGAT